MPFSFLGYFLKLFCYFSSNREQAGVSYDAAIYETLQKPKEMIDHFADVFCIIHRQMYTVLYTTTIGTW
jgi:hypothetical protein